MRSIFNLCKDVKINSFKVIPGHKCPYGHNSFHISKICCLALEYTKKCKEIYQTVFEQLIFIFISKLR